MPSKIVAFISIKCFISYLYIKSYMVLDDVALNVSFCDNFCSNMIQQPTVPFAILLISLGLNSQI